MDYLRKNSNRGSEDMESPRILEKKNVEIPGVNKKKFPKVLVSGLGNSNGYNIILWNFQGETSFCLEFPPLFGFFLEQLNG